MHFGGLQKYGPRSAWLQGAAWFAITLVALCLFSWLTGLLGEVCHAKPEGGDPECHRYNLAYAILIQGFVWLNDFSVVIGAVATALLTAITYFLWRLERETGETNEAQLRAYVEVEPKGFKLAPNGKDLTVYIERKNVGKTPAIAAEVYWNIGVMEKPWTKPLELNESIPPSGIVRAITYPDKANALAKEIPLPDEQIYDLMCPQCGVALYVFGRTRYRDIFGKTIEADFCTYIDHADFVAWREAALKQPNAILPAHFRYSVFNNDIRIGGKSL
jgi:hypothetical protein